MVVRYVMAVIYISDELHKRLKLASEVFGRSMKIMSEEAIGQYVEKMAVRLEQKVRERTARFLALGGDTDGADGADGEVTDTVGEAARLTEVPRLAAVTPVSTPASPASPASPAVGRTQVAFDRVAQLSSAQEEAAGIRKRIERQEAQIRYHQSFTDRDAEREEKKRKAAQDAAEEIERLEERLAELTEMVAEIAEIGEKG